MPPPEPATQTLRAEERLLFAIAYRMTGSAADADDIVQEAFARALEHPPAGERRPYLVRIASNLARDRLRRRKREGYRGPWVPSPIDEDVLTEERASLEPTPEARYDLAESASLAFLLALEALPPKARQVLVLRDVFDCSVEETAQATGLAVSNVKVTHHRARRVLERYEPSRRDPALATAALTALMTAVASGDLERAKSLLADDAVCLQDGGGEYLAAGIELSGPERIVRVLDGVTRRASPIASIELRALSGTAGFVARTQPTRAKVAPRWVILCDLAPDGRIRTLYTVLASRKLSRVA